MAGNATTMGGHIKEDGVCGDPFLGATDIGSRKAGLEMLVERIVDGSTVELGCKFQGFADTFDRYPYKIWAQGINIRQLGFELAAIMYQCLHILCPPWGSVKLGLCMKTANV